jgi:hypothetical protein
MGKDDGSALERALELLENNYKTIGDLERELAKLLPYSEESRDELVDIFRRYRGCHHKLRRDIGPMFGCINVEANLIGSNEERTPVPLPPLNLIGSNEERKPVPPPPLPLEQTNENSYKK